MPSVPEMAAGLRRAGLAEYKIASGEDPTTTMTAGRRVDHQARTPRSVTAERQPEGPTPRCPISERHGGPPERERRKASRSPGAGSPDRQDDPRRADRRPADLGAGAGRRRRVVAGRRVLRVRARRGQLRLLHRAGPAAEVPAARPAVPDRVPAVHDGCSPAFTSFTNYGTGHLDDKDAAITAIAGAERRAGRGRAASTRSCRSSRTARCRCWSPTRTPGRCSIGTNEGLTPVPDGRRPARRREGHRGHRLREPEPGHAERRTRTTRPSGRRCSRRSTQDAGHLPAPDLGHPGHRGPVRATSTTRPRTRWSTPPTGEVFPADESVGNFVSADGRGL